MNIRLSPIGLTFALERKGHAPHSSPGSRALGGNDVAACSTPKAGDLGSAGVGGTGAKAGTGGTAITGNAGAGGTVGNAGTGGTSSPTGTGGTESGEIGGITGTELLFGRRRVHDVVADDAHVFLRTDPMHGSIRRRTSSQAGGASRG
jgi:hypothetical protein